MGHVRADGRSDEPARLHGIISSLFGGQSGIQLWETDHGSAQMAVGASDQDDCAVIDLTGHAMLVAGSDYVRGPQFTLYRAGLLSEYDLGYFLVVANLSDIAAMGAHPLGVLTVVRYPQEMTDDSFESLMRGIADACAASSTHNVGGDIGTAERIILSGTALGMCSPGEVLLRSGARPGDVLCVSGDVGSAGAAVAAFGDPEFDPESLSAQARSEMIEAWRRPVARIIEGRLLSQEKLASACMDTSDGLRASIMELGRASGVGFVIREDTITITAAVREVADRLSIDPVSLALSASVDFQLAFTVPFAELPRCHATFANRNLDLRVLGEATRDTAISLLRRDGIIVSLPGVPWRHQGSAFRVELKSAEQPRRP
jgi:thiamine-monophosphate kinase